ncbi:MAG: ribonuclease HI family protein [Candidatus Omnitrophota bacterium]|nr:ribonuclease HI family protein [Candidatus Omnitrophota bacterium]
MSKNLLSIYTDGAARGNPGPAGAGVILKESDKMIKVIHKYLGDATNNVAEYSAVISGLREAAALGYKNVVLYTDSELVARQLKGEYRVKNSSIKILFNKTISLINNFDNVAVKKIDRAGNKEADKLANKAINLSGLNKPR